MKNLPLWNRPATLPAFNDGESASVIEMTYKLYQAMQTLIDEYNVFAEEVNKKIADHVEKYEGDMEVFTTSLRQEFQDFIDVIDLKVAKLDQQYKDVVATHEAEIKAYVDQYEANIKAYFDEVIQNNITSTWEAEY